MNQVYTTNDYSKFKFIDGNRTINKLHLNRLKKSMEEKYIDVPIIINEHKEIIDGQHRFLSAWDLGLPIKYIQIDGLKLQDVHRLNTNTKNWTADSYLEGFCKLGLPDYLTYKDFKNKYGFGHNETTALLKNCKRFHGGGSNDFKDGTFKIVDYSLAIKNAEKIHMVSKYYDGFKRRAFVYCMLDLFENPDYNHAEFLNKLSFQSVKLQDCTTVEQYLCLIEDIYNFKRNKQSKVRFY
jgi:hypothetical protein